MGEKARIIKIVTVSMIIFIALLFVALMINLIKTTQVNAKLNRLNKAHEELALQIEQSQNEIDYKSTDEFIEWYARNYLNMKGKDETVYKAK